MDARAAAAVAAHGAIPPCVSVLHVPLPLNLARPPSRPPGAPHCAALPFPRRPRQQPQPLHVLRHTGQAAVCRGHAAAVQVLCSALAAGVLGQGRRARPGSHPRAHCCCGHIVLLPSAQRIRGPCCSLLPTYKSSLHSPRSHAVLLQTLPAQVLVSIGAACATAPSPAALRAIVPTATLVGLARDLRGIASATSTRRTYCLLFDWLYPQHLPSLLRCLEAYAGACVGSACAVARVLRQVMQHTRSL